MSNLVLLTVDCLRPDHLSCYGYPKKVGSRIQSLANRGAAFYQAFSNGPNTYTSFPSIMTSTYSRMNIIGRERGYPDRWLFLSPENITIAEALSAKGYMTAAFHANPWISSFFRYNRGFVRFFDSLSDYSRENYITVETGVRNRVGRLVSRAMGLCYALLGEDEYSPSARSLNQKALSWLEGNRPRKFFLWVHYMDVHMPRLPPQLTFLARIAAVKLEAKIEKTHRLSNNELGSFVDLYDQAIEHTDREIGLFFDKLEELNVNPENTYFIIAADHGEQLMEHGGIGHGLLYDENIRVPLIILGPGIDAETKLEDQVSLLDLGPTILDFLHLGKVSSFLGESLRPLIRGESRKRAIMSENLKPVVSARNQKWKCIVSFHRNAVELYDIRKDPKEERNLAKEETEIAGEMLRVIQDHVQMEDSFRRRRFTRRSNRPTPTDERIKARLARLGYF